MPDSLPLKRACLLLILLCGFQVLNAQHNASRQIRILTGYYHPYQAIEKIAAQYKEDTGIEVIVEPATDHVIKYRQMEERARPDILIAPHSRIGELVPRHLIGALTLSRSTVNDFDSLGWEAFRYEGKVYGYPISMDAPSLIYNRQLIERAPVTFEEIFTLDVNLKREGKSAILWEYSNAFFTWPLLAAGGAYAFKRLPDGTYDLDDHRIMDQSAAMGMDLIKRMINKGLMHPKATFSEAQSDFLNGKLACWIAESWVLADCQRYGIDYGVAPLPTVYGKAARPYVSVMGAMINAASPDRTIAMDFIENYLLSDEGLARMDKDKPIMVPAKLSYYEQKSLDINVQAARKNLGQGVLLPNMPEMSKFWLGMKDALKYYLIGRLSAHHALLTVNYRLVVPLPKVIIVPSAEPERPRNLGAEAGGFQD